MTRWGGLVLAMACLAGVARAQPLVYEGAPLREVIADAERRTPWRFLYSDALVAGKRVGVSAEPDALPQALALALGGQGIRVEADPERWRILLVPGPARAERRAIRGRVLDGETGAPLPFAAVTWEAGRRGVAADASGDFLASVGGSPDVTLTASFVGYASETASPRGEAVVFRLRPLPVAHPVVHVHAPMLAAPVDTAWAARLRPGRYDAVGAGGGLRALEVLPAVAPSTALDAGPVVRGSPADAFEVRLDGVPIYSPRHLFGLVDAFNADALQAVALHLGVAPARVALAPGGAVDYVTAMGSPLRPTVLAGVSNLAVRAAVAAPLRPGRTTALLGGRHSLLGVAPWPDDALIEVGLGAERLTIDLPPSVADPLSRVLDVRETRASFWDFHAGVVDERAAGGRLAVTGYAGGDDARLDALRLFSRSDTPASADLVRRPVQTQSRWGAQAGSVLDQRPLGARAMLRTRLGGSAYDARFEQDDFTFATDATDPLQAAVDTFGFTNRLLEGLIAQQLEVGVGQGLASGGYSLHLYQQRYEETAGPRQPTTADETAARLDLHAAWSGALLPRLHVDAGLRALVYSAGSVVRLGPRVQARLEAAPGVTLSAAVGRSTQVLHRLTLDNGSGTAAWVLSNDGATITEADLVEVGLDLAGRWASVQLTGYAKRTRGLWLHTGGRALRGVAGASVLERPWLTGVQADARGLEALARVPVGAWSAGVSAALTSVELRHPVVQEGAAFPAAWERPTSVTLLADGPVLPGVRLAAAWTMASGLPNPLFGRRDGEAERLDPLRRLDLRLTARRRLTGATLSASLAVRNVLDRDNTIAREPTAVVQRNAAGEQRIRILPLDVYDFGRLPSLAVALRW